MWTEISHVCNKMYCASNPLGTFIDWRSKCCVTQDHTFKHFRCTCTRFMTSVTNDRNPQRQRHDNLSFTRSQKSNSIISFVRRKEYSQLCISISQSNTTYFDNKLKLIYKATCFDH